MELCVVLELSEGGRIPTSGFALLGMTEGDGGGLRRFIVRPQRTLPKSARKTNQTCHCEERSDVAIRISLRLCVVLVLSEGGRIPTSGFALLGMTEGDGGGLRRFIVRPQRTLPKSARKTNQTCHCEERSDVAIRISLELCVVLMRCKGERIPTSRLRTGSRRRLCRIVPLGRMTEWTEAGCTNMAR